MAAGLGRGQLGPGVARDRSPSPRSTVRPAPPASGPNRSSPWTPTGSAGDRARRPAGRSRGRPKSRGSATTSTCCSSASQVRSAMPREPPVSMATRPCTRAWSLIAAIFSAVCDHSGSAVEYAHQRDLGGAGHPLPHLRGDPGPAFAELLGEAVRQPLRAVAEHRAARGRRRVRPGSAVCIPETAPTHHHDHGGGDQGQPGRRPLPAPVAREGVAHRVAVRGAGRARRSRLSRINVSVSCSLRVIRGLRW